MDESNIGAMLYVAGIFFGSVYIISTFTPSENESTYKEPEQRDDERMYIDQEQIDLLKNKGFSEEQIKDSLKRLGTL